MCSPDFLRDHAEELIGLADASIRHGLAHGRPLPVDLARHPAQLREPRACFVTLRRGGGLRGCVGRLEPEAPLVAEVADRAWAAASADPRFPPLAPAELHDLAIHLAVLGPLEALPAGSEAELLAALEPGRDGLVLEAGGRRATFLPGVWEALPEAARFVRELERKAGLAGAWPADARAWRYRVVALEGSQPEEESR